MTSGETPRRTQASHSRRAMNSSSESLYSASFTRSCHVQKLELPTRRQTMTCQETRRRHIKFPQHRGRRLKNANRDNHMCQARKICQFRAIDKLVLHMTSIRQNHAPCNAVGASAERALTCEHFCKCDGCKRGCQEALRWQKV